MKRRRTGYRTRRRPAKRARRTFKRRATRRRRGVRSGVHHFRRMLANSFPLLPTGTGAQNPAGSISGNAAFNPWTGGFQLNGINGVVNPVDFTALFDQYRINKIVTKFHLRIDPGAQSAAGASYPRLYYYRDLDDSTAPVNLNEMRENSKVRMTVMNPNRPTTLVTRPNSLAILFQSAIANQFKPVFKQWMDMGTATTPHYLWKVAIDDLTNTNYSVHVESILYFSCRQPR